MVRTLGLRTLDLRSRSRWFSSCSGRYQVVNQLLCEFATVCGQVNHIGIQPTSGQVNHIGI